MKNRCPFPLFLITLLFTCCFVGCCFPNSSSMPFNGDVTFHELQLTIPTAYIRDSTQSNEDFWVFEQGGYDQLILLSRRELSSDPDTILDTYVGSMQEIGATAQKTTFLNQDAVHSTYTQEGVFCQEMLFIYNGSTYAIALRGGTEEGFSALLDSVNLTEMSAEM